MADTTDNKLTIKNNSKDFLNYSLLILETCGLYSEENTKMIQTIATIYVILLVFLGSVSFLQFIYIEGNIFEFVNNLEAVGAFSHICGKIVVTVYHRKIIMRLIECTKFFWSTKICTYTVKNELNYISMVNTRLQTVFFGCILASISVLELSPMFGKGLVTGVWKMKEQGLLHKVVLILQLIMFPILCTFLFAFESIFLTFCIKVIIQFRILGERFKQLQMVMVSSEDSQKQFYNELKICIKQHCFLLRFSKILRQFYSPAILVEYLTITPLICTEMYALFESKDFNLLFRHTVVCLTLISDLAIYCIPADYVTSEASEVAHAVYNSDWYLKYFRALRNPITFIIQRSQQEFIFTAGGLFNINAKSLLAVLRVSYSACTVARAAKSD